MSDDREEFCWNSRRWVIWMAMLNSIPSTCPYNIANSGCAGGSCGYHEMRKPTKHFKRVEQGVRRMYADED